MTSGRIAVISDIHGNLKALQSMIDLLSYEFDGTVFVGDYVNRGTDSRGVIELLSSLNRTRDDFHFLKGNHDEAFLAVLEGGSLPSFFAMGGARQQLRAMSAGQKLM